MKLAAENVSRNFIRARKSSGTLIAVREANLVLEEGKLISLSGASGSGKSTLLNMLAGLLPPSEGKILLDGTDLYSLEDRELSAKRNEHMGVIPQGQTALQALNVLENVLTPYVLYHKTRSGEYDKVLNEAQNLLEKAGIRELADEMPSELSGGELRRMAVCRALLLKPAFILADEPTGDLDEENTGIIMQMLRERADTGCSILTVTHDKQVFDYADVLMEMKNGVLTVS